jgi:hypothetical protein
MYSDVQMLRNKTDVGSLLLPLHSLHRPRGPGRGRYRRRNLWFRALRRRWSLSNYRQPERLVLKAVADNVDALNIIQVGTGPLGSDRSAESLLR